MDIHNYIETFRYGYDVTKKEVMSKFKYFDYEKEFINHINDNRFSIIKKSRQLHITNLLSNYVAWKMLYGNYYDSENILYIANSIHLSQHFIDLVRDNIIKFIHIMNNSDITEETVFKTNNKLEIRLTNNCTIKGVSSSKDALRGWGPSLVIMDEAAFIDQGNSLMGAVMTSLGTGGRMIMTSTPNGLDKAFYKTFELTLEGKSGFKPMCLNWIDNPLFTYEWYEDMCRNLNMNQLQIKQELLGQFVFKKDGLKGMSLKDKVFYEPLERDYFDKNNKPTKEVWYSMDIVENAPQSGAFFEYYKKLINSLERE